MSVKLMSLVWETDLLPRQKIVLLAYADHAHDDGTSVHPSRSLMSRKTGYSEDSVQRITGELEELGVMEKEYGGYRGQVAVRKIDVTVLNLLAKGTQLAPQSGERGANNGEWGANSPEKGGTSAARNHQEPSEPAADPELEPDGSVSAAPHHYCRTEHAFVDLPKSDCPTNCQPKEEVAV